jgi:hypothetical protein
MKRSGLALGVIHNYSQPTKIIEAKCIKFFLTFENDDATS